MSEIDILDSLVLHVLIHLLHLKSLCNNQVVVPIKADRAVDIIEGTFNRVGKVRSPATVVADDLKRGHTFGELDL